MNVANPSTRRLMACSAASVSVHAIGAAAIFLGFGMASSTPQPAAQMVLELAALPSAPPEPNEAPPQPEQKKAAPKPAEQKIHAPQLKVALNTPPEVMVPKADPQLPTPERNDKPAEETTRAATPDAPNRDTVKAPVAGAPSNSRSNAAQSWEARIITLLESKKRFPAASKKQGQQDIVYIALTIDADGRLIDGKIRRSQGFALIDGEVTSLIRRIPRFPEPPADVLDGKSAVKILVPVAFYIDRPSRGGRG